MIWIDGHAFYDVHGFGRIEGSDFGLATENDPVKRTDTRKTITGTSPGGKLCRDERLFGERYSERYSKGRVGVRLSGE